MGSTSQTAKYVAGNLSKLALFMMKSPGPADSLPPNLYSGLGQY